MMFTPEEIILEDEIKRKDTIKMRYTPQPEEEVVKLLGSNMVVLTNVEDPTDI